MSRFAGRSRIKDLYPEIDWKAIAGMRNVLVHDYFDVDFEALWDVIFRDLPPLESVMRSMIAEIGRVGSAIEHGDAVPLKRDLATDFQDHARIRNRMS